MELYEQIELQECPICGGAGLMEEENGWCFYAACLDCGAHTAEIRYERDAGSGWMRPSGRRTCGTSARS